MSKKYFSISSSIRAGSIIVLFGIGFIFSSLAFQNCSSQFKTSDSSGLSDSASSRDSLDSTPANDLFLIIGQSNSVGIGPVSQPSTLSMPFSYAFDFDSDMGTFKPLTDPTGIPNNRCGSPCYWTAKTHGFLPSLAYHWKLRTGNNSFFVPRGSSGAGLLESSDAMTNVGWWTMFHDTSGNIPVVKHLYQNALTDLVAGYQSLVAKNQTVNHIFVIWYQGETDAILGTSTNEYSVGLKSIVQNLSKDFRLKTGRNIDGFAIGKIGYFFNWNNQNNIPDHRDRIHRIQDGLQQVQVDASNEGLPPVFIVANAAIEFMSPCIQGLNSEGCESADGIHYTTNGYERLGKQIAKNLNQFLISKKFPLDPSSCYSSKSAAACSPMYPIYQWQTTSGKKVFSNSYLEFDSSAASGVSFNGVKVHLYPPDFHDERMIQIFRSYKFDSVPSIDSFVYGTLDSLPGALYPLLTPLGSCFKSAQTEFSRPVSFTSLTGTDQIICYIDSN